MTEADHVEALIESYPMTGFDRLVWGGFEFHWSHVTHMVTVYTQDDEGELPNLKKLVFFRAERSELTALAVAFRVPQAIRAGYAKPRDGVPWEIHQIHDFDAYMAALTAYSANAL